jgi:hypothetical protein
MGLYFSAEFWFARTGVGLYGGREDGWGATVSSRGRGETTAVPNCAKLAGVRGSGVSVIVGLVVRIGAMLILGQVSTYALFSIPCLLSMKERKKKKIWIGRSFKKLMRRCRRPPLGSPIR